MKDQIWHNCAVGDTDTEALARAIAHTAAARLGISENDLLPIAQETVARLTTKPEAKAANSRLLRERDIDDRIEARKQLLALVFVTALDEINASVRVGPLTAD